MEKKTKQIKTQAAPMPESEVIKLSPAMLKVQLAKRFNAELDLWTDPTLVPSVAFNYTRLAVQAMKQSLIEGKLHPKLVVHELGWSRARQDALAKRNKIV